MPRCAPWRSSSCSVCCGDRYPALPVDDDPRHSDAKLAVAALVRRAQGGDVGAFAQLHAEFARVVHGIVLAHGLRTEAEDVTQDVFLAAYERLPRLRDAEAFAGWLCAAARNAAIDAGRRQRRRGDEELHDAHHGGRDPATIAETADAAAKVLDCIVELPKAYRETLVLRLCEGLDGPEIAARTGLTHGSVRVNLTRGMALLRPLLAARGLP